MNLTVEGLKFMLSFLSTVNEKPIFGEIIGGSGVEIDYTDLTFNNDAVLAGENLTAQGTAAANLVNPGTQF